VVGMLQILTYMLAFYLVLKGLEILQIGLASSLPDEERSRLAVFATIVLIACIIAAIVFVVMQDHQAARIGSPSWP
jgi:ABC-type glycerol-3-phosphate transport system permease component